MNVKNIAKTGLLICLLYFISVMLILLYSNEITVLLMEIVTMFSGIYMVLLIISLLADNHFKHKIYRLLAIISVASCMLLTNSAHWISIIIVNPLIKSGIDIPKYLRIGTEHSLIIAIDYLGWGLFMGLAFIFSGCNLRLSTNLKRILWINGILCLIGFFGVVIDKNLWYIAPLGYGIGTAVICVKLLGKTPQALFKGRKRNLQPLP